MWTRIGRNRMSTKINEVYRTSTNIEEKLTKIERRQTTSRGKAKVGEIRIASVVARKVTPNVPARSRRVSRGQRYLQQPLRSVPARFRFTPQCQRCCREVNSDMLAMLCDALRCFALHVTASCCIALRCNALHCIVLRSSSAFPPSLFPLIPRPPPFLAPPSSASSRSFLLRL